MYLYLKLLPTFTQNIFSLNNILVTLDLRYKPIEDIHFVTDKCFWGRGFYGLFEQIPCQDVYPSTQDDEIPTSTVQPFSTITPTCDRDIQENYFRIEIDRNFVTCSITISRSSPVSRNIIYL